jgi:hypothetical protein
MSRGRKGAGHIRIPGRLRDWVSRIGHHSLCRRRYLLWLGYSGCGLISSSGISSQLGILELSVSCIG